MCLVIVGAPHLAYHFTKLGPPLDSVCVLTEIRLLAFLARDLLIHFYGLCRSPMQICILSFHAFNDFGKGPYCVNREQAVHLHKVKVCLIINIYTSNCSYGLRSNFIKFASIYRATNI